MPSFLSGNKEGGHPIQISTSGATGQEAHIGREESHGSWKNQGFKLWFYKWRIYVLPCLFRSVQVKCREESHLHACKTNVEVKGMCMEGDRERERAPSANGRLTTCHLALPLSNCHINQPVCWIGTMYNTVGICLFETSVYCCFVSSPELVGHQ